MPAYPFNNANEIRFSRNINTKQFFIYHLGQLILQLDLNENTSIYVERTVGGQQLVLNKGEMDFNVTSAALHSHLSYPSWIFFMALQNGNYNLIIGQDDIRPYNRARIIDGLANKAYLKTYETMAGFFLAIK